MTSGLVIIGAQKCATATVNSDLSKCSGFQINVDAKERSPLLDLGVFGSRKAVKHFQPVKAGDVCVDVSTRYSMAPIDVVDFTQLQKILPNLKVVYLVRNPLERTLSHYQHNAVVGVSQRKFESDVRITSPYVINSLYGSQILPWVDSFGAENIMLLEFSEYVNNRIESIKKICHFAGVSHAGLAEDDFGFAENVTKNRNKLPGKISAFQRTAVFQKFIRPIVPEQIRRKAKLKLEIPNNTERASISKIHADYLNDIFGVDNRHLRSLIENAPSWDFEV